MKNTTKTITSKILFFNKEKDGGHKVMKLINNCENKIYDYSYYEIDGRKYVDIKVYDKITNKLIRFSKNIFLSDDYLMIVHAEDYDKNYIADNILDDNDDLIKTIYNYGGKIVVTYSKEIKDGITTIIDKSFLDGQFIISTEKESKTVSILFDENNNKLGSELIIKDKDNNEKYTHYTKIFTCGDRKTVVEAYKYTLDDMHFTKVYEDGKLIHTQQGTNQGILSETNVKGGIVLDDNTLYKYCNNIDKLYRYQHNLSTYAEYHDTNKISKFRMLTDRYSLYRNTIYNDYNEPVDITDTIIMLDKSHKPYYKRTRTSKCIDIDLSGKLKRVEKTTLSKEYY